MAALLSLWELLDVSASSSTSSSSSSSSLLEGKMKIVGVTRH